MIAPLLLLLLIALNNSLTYLLCVSVNTAIYFYSGKKLVILISFSLSYYSIIASAFKINNDRKLDTLNPSVLLK